MSPTGAALAAMMITRIPNPHRSASQKRVLAHIEASAENGVVALQLVGAWSLPFHLGGIFALSRNGAAPAIRARARCDSRRSSRARVALAPSTSRGECRARLERAERIDPARARSVGAPCARSAKATRLCVLASAPDRSRAAHRVLKSPIRRSGRTRAPQHRVARRATRAPPTQTPRNTNTRLYATRRVVAVLAAAVGEVAVDDREARDLHDLEASLGVNGRAERALGRGERPVRVEANPRSTATLAWTKCACGVRLHSRAAVGESCSIRASVLGRRSRWARRPRNGW